MQRGFTLIEVLVVMLIVGLLATTLSLSLAPDQHRQLDEEAYRVANLLELAVEASEMGDSLALEWREDGMAFMRPQANGSWRRVSQGLFAARLWPEGIQASVAAASASSPPWLLWQDNRSPLLELSLHGATQRRLLRLSPLGRVTVSAEPL
jgi:general secretion pathway protein H